MLDESGHTSVQLCGQPLGSEEIYQREDSLTDWKIRGERETSEWEADEERASEPAESNQSEAQKHLNLNHIGETFVSL